jgi:hypothetical protein
MTKNPKESEHKGEQVATATNIGIISGQTNVSRFISPLTLVYVNPSVSS